MERLLSTDRKIASHRNRYSPPEHPPNTLLLAYEDNKYAKMVRELGHVDDELKLKILEELNEDFRRGDKIVLASITSEMTKSLVDHSKDENPRIREWSSQALVQTCKIAQTRKIVVTNGYTKDIKILIEDKEVNIRRNAYQAMLEVCHQEYAAQDLINLDMVEVCVRKLAVQDEDQILVLVHELIRQLLLVDNGTQRFLAMENGIGISNICNFLTNENSKLRQAALKNLYCVSCNFAGKKLELSMEVIEQTAELLKDNVLEVRTAAVLTLCSICQLIDGKKKVSIQMLLLRTFPFCRRV